MGTAHNKYDNAINFGIPIVVYYYTRSLGYAALTFGGIVAFDLYTDTGGLFRPPGPPLHARMFGSLDPVGYLERIFPSLKN